jgi:hypothetical protein
MSGRAWVLLSKALKNHIPIVQPTRCTYYLKLFIIVKSSIYFERYFVHHQEPKTAYTATVYVKQLLLSGMRWNCERACYLKLFIFVRRLAFFGRSFRPSSGAQNCVYSNGICQTTAAIGDEMELRTRLLSQIIYFCKTLSMFRTVFPSIIRSSKCVYSNGIYQTTDEGRKDRPKHVEDFTSINN